MSNYKCEICKDTFWLCEDRPNIRCECWYEKKDKIYKYPLVLTFTSTEERDEFVGQIFDGWGENLPINTSFDYKAGSGYEEGSIIKVDLLERY
jgi:hypothetical protein